jgi:predicted metal-dependent phosphoesterase TrpH
MGPDSPHRAQRPVVAEQAVVRFDLQCHSTCSDGALAPADVIALAADEGVELVALTDHDTVGGVDEALAAGSRHGVRVIPAVELSIVDPAAVDLHVLGYGVDHTDERLLAALACFRADRRGRVDRMATRLRELGFAIDEQLLEPRAGCGAALGRPHLAQAVLASPENMQRLVGEGIGDVGGFIRRYLSAGRPAFAARTLPVAADAIDLIHAAGGVAVWAHPFWDIGEQDAVVRTLERFCALGLDGVEAFYVTHEREQTDVLVRAAARHGLLTTGSSDFHGPDHRHFAGFRAFDLHGHVPALGPLGASARATSRGG